MQTQCQNLMCICRQTAVSFPLFSPFVRICLDLVRKSTINSLSFPYRFSTWSIAKRQKKGIRFTKKGRTRSHARSNKPQIRLDNEECRVKPKANLCVYLNKLKSRNINVCKHSKYFVYLFILINKILAIVF